MKNAEGRSLHDMTWALDTLPALPRNGRMANWSAVWPNKWKATPESLEVTYKGMGDIKVPPWMLKKAKAAPAAKVKAEPKKK